MVSFSESYLNIAYWTEAYGWIEIGQDEYSESFLDALNDLEVALGKIIKCSH